MEVDLATLTFYGLIGLGTVNALTMWKPDLDSKVKLLLSGVVVFAATFIPVELGNVFLEKAKIAIEIALASSGGYKLATKAGGK